jgi:ubiquinone biosynthesis protein
VVAIKVQYPDLGPRVAMDLALLKLALRLFAVVTPGWPMHLFYEEIARTSREEQDYLCEATAAERLRPLLARRRVDVPRVLFEHTRETVLVMEFAAGTTLASTDLSQLTPEKRRDLADRVIDAWLDMALEAGFFHGDPHAGNFIVDVSSPEPRLWLIDFGMTATLDANVRLIYARFLRCLVRDDTDGMVDTLAELGVLLPGADLNGLKALAREVYGSLANLNPRVFKGSRREQELSDKVAGFLRRARGIAFPRHTILLTRALGLVEGLIGELVPDDSLLNLAKPRLRRLASPVMLARDLLTSARDRLQRLAGLPDRVEAALAARSGPDFTPLVAALVLIAALQVPEPWRPWATAIAGLALLGSLLRRSR